MPKKRKKNKESEPNGKPVTTSKVAVVVLNNLPRFKKSDT